MQQPSKIILGIDPGTLVMGYGLIQVSGQRIELINMDVLSLNPKRDMYDRLAAIHSRVTELIREFKPHTFAIESPFFGKNVQSMLKLGRAQGVAIAAAMQGGLEVSEYSPKKVKQSITGNGNADKEQVWQMLQRIVSIETAPRFFDATDALAVAICHHYQTSNPLLKTKGKQYKDWSDFVRSQSK